MSDFQTLMQNIRFALATHSRNLDQLEQIGKTEEQVHQECACELQRLLDGARMDAWQFNDKLWAEARADYDELELNPTFIEIWTEA